MGSIIVFLLGAVVIVAVPIKAAVGYVTLFVALSAARRGGKALAILAARQLWRLKWLLLASFVLVGLPVPGTPLGAGLPDYLPSREGIALASVQFARVALIAVLFAAEPGMLTTGERVAGLYRLLAYFGKTGVRVALRVALTLQELETARREDHWAALRGELRSDGEASRCVIDLPAIGVAEYALIALAAASFLVCLASRF